MAGPLFGYILTTQVAFLVVQNVANAASNHASYDGFPAYSYAWQLFQMPYAIVGISVITALLPRMSAQCVGEELPLVKSDFSGGVRLSSVIVVPAAAHPGRARPGAGGGAVRLRQHHRGRGALHRPGVRHLLAGAGAVHDVPAHAARVLRHARQPHPYVHRGGRDGHQHRRQPAGARRAAGRSRGRGRGGGVRAGQHRGRRRVVRSSCPAACTGWPESRSRAA